MFFIGFLWINDEFIPGNLGLRDQLFALDWLYNNIVAFGGDPMNMALVGQGSGAASIAYHYQYDGSKKTCLRFNNKVFTCQHYKTNVAYLIFKFLS